MAAYSPAADTSDLRQGSARSVTAPQFPESSLADDVARLRQVLERQNGPTVVAAHSYGGQIMTALGTDAPNVVALVYIAAFGLSWREKRTCTCCE
jgi:pimeloyl-ACP methyl ester carboxylesterase